MQLPWEAKNAAGAIGVAASVLAGAMLTLLLSPPAMITAPPKTVWCGEPVAWVRTWGICCLLAFSFAAACLIDIIQMVHVGPRIPSELGETFFLDAFQMLALSLVPTSVAIVCATVLADYSRSVFVVACYVLILQVCHVLHHLIICYKQKAISSDFSLSGVVLSYIFFFTLPLMLLDTLINFKIFWSIRYYCCGRQRRT